MIHQASKTRRFRNRSFVGFVALLWCAGGWVPLLAHEFWLSPSSHRAETGESISLYAMVGDGRDALPVTRRADHLKRFSFYDGHRHRNIGGKGARLPTGTFRSTREGLHVISYESLPQATELPSDKFTQYLLAEGLESILEARGERGESAYPAREIFSRCAKSLIQIGSEWGGDCVLGLPIEIIALTDPARLEAGQSLVVRVLRSGAPVAGILVKSFSLVGEKHSTGVRTDEEGYARMPIPQVGRWMLNAVFMERHLVEDEADWRSYWASLTFEVPENKESAESR